MPAKSSSAFPKSSPWGNVDQYDRIGDGICRVYTPSHGGIWLSPERSKIVQELFGTNGFRPFAGSWSWLEEDCDWVLAAIAFPDLFSPKEVAYSLRVVNARDYYRCSLDPDSDVVSAANSRAAEYVPTAECCN